MGRRTQGPRRTRRALAAVVVLGWVGVASAAQAADPAPLPSVDVTVPLVTVPPVTVPPLGQTATSVPSAVAVPPVTVPQVTLPPVTLPPELSVPGVVDVPLPGVTLPAPVGLGDTATPTPSGGPAAASAAGAPAGDTPSRVSAGGGTRVTAGGGRPRAGTAVEAGPRPSPAPAPQDRPSLPTRLRRAAAETALQLSFPMGLCVLLAAFLLLQHRMDRADPRLAPRGGVLDDDLLGFS